MRGRLVARVVSTPGVYSLKLLCETVNVRVVSRGAVVTVVRNRETWKHDGNEVSSLGDKLTVVRSLENRARGT